MKISKVIEKLKEIQSEKGDLNVASRAIRKLDTAEDIDFVDYNEEFNIVCLSSEVRIDYKGNPNPPTGIYRFTRR